MNELLLDNENSANENKELISVINNLKTIYSDIKGIYMRHVEFYEKEAYDFFPLWIFGTYIFEDFESYPYVYLYGSKRCGKSKCLNLTSKLARSSLNTVNVSQASVYRAIEEYKPTLFLDEADYINSEEKSELYKILNSGYKKGAVVLRCETNGKNETKLKEWNVYCPKMLASVTELREQFIDRCIGFLMIRSRMKEIINAEIKEKIDDNNISWDIYTNFLKEYIPKIKNIIMENLEKIDVEEINGRDRELYKPILAIAMTLDKEIYNSILHMAIEKIKKSEELEKENIECGLISILIEMYTNDDWYSVKDLTEKMRNDAMWDGVNIRTVGKILRRLNFQHQKRMNGAYYYISKDNIIDKSRRYGVEIDKQFDIGNYTN